MSDLLKRQIGDVFNHMLCSDPSLIDVEIAPSSEKTVPKFVYG